MNDTKSLPPTQAEWVVLKSFYKGCAPQMGLYNKTANSVAIEHPHAIATLSIIRSFVKKGVSLSRLKQLAAFHGRARPHTTDFRDVVQDEEVQFATEESSEENLITETSMFLHPTLVKTSVEIRTLEMGSENSTGNSEPTITYETIFTKKDLVNYYCRAMSIEDPDANEVRTLSGAFNFLLRTYTLDAILFAIDDARINEDLLRSPLELKDKYMTNVQEYLHSVKARRPICNHQNNGNEL